MLHCNCPFCLVCVPTNKETLFTSFSSFPPSDVSAVSRRLHPSPNAHMQLHPQTKNHQRVRGMQTVHVQRSYVVLRNLRTHRKVSKLGSPAYCV
jgi:hypothetical protein